MMTLIGVVALSISACGGDSGSNHQITGVLTSDGTSAVNEGDSVTLRNANGTIVGATTLAYDSGLASETEHDDDCDSVGDTGCIVNGQLVQPSGEYDTDGDAVGPHMS